MTTATSGVLARFPLLLPVRNSFASYGASAVAPRPAVSFGGKSVSAVAMLVGGGLELQLPLYCVDDVPKTIVDLRPEGAPALRTVNCQRTQITTRAVHDLLRDTQGRLARMPPDPVTGEPRSGQELSRDSPTLLSDLVDSLGVQVIIARLHSPIAKVTPGYLELLHITRSSFTIDPGFLVFKSGDCEGSQAGGDGRVKKVTVVVHKWALVDT